MPDLLTFDLASYQVGWTDEPIVQSGGSGGGGWDSTDDRSGYFTQEMSTGAWDWNNSAMTAQINHDIQGIYSHAANSDAGINGIAAYLTNIGLGSLVHGTVDSSYNASNGYLGSVPTTTLPDGTIVVTGSTWVPSYIPSINGAGTFGAVTWDAANTPQNNPHAFDFTGIGADFGFQHNTQIALDYLEHSPTAADVIAKAKAAGAVVHLTTGDDITIGKDVYWNPSKAVHLTTGGIISPAMALLHELAHTFGGVPKTPDPRFDNAEEARVILTYEQPAERELGEPVRGDHDGTYFSIDPALGVGYHTNH